MSKEVEKNMVAEEAAVAVSEQVTTAVAVSTEDAADAGLIGSLKHTASANFYCSIVNDGSRKAKAQIYNAISSADEDLSEHKGELLEIVNVAAHTVKMVDQTTGEIKDAGRVVLIDKDGVAYQCVSEGVISSLNRIFNIVGRPDDNAWVNEPLMIKPVEKKTRQGFKVLTLDLVV